MKKEIIMSSKAPKAIGPYSHGVEANGFLFISGQLGIDPVTGEMPDGLEEQTHLSLQNIKAILEEARLDLGCVVKTTVFLKDMNQFTLINDLYGQYFTGDFPARSAIEVARLPKNGKIEIECIAVKK